MKNKIACTLMGAFLMLSISLTARAAGEDKLVIPDGYINEKSVIKVETSENADKELVSVRVKINHGAYKDITESKSFSVNDNCTVYVKARYKDSEGNESFEEYQKDITSFDGVAPKINAYVKGEDLTINIEDEVSGPAILNVDGIDYTDLSSGAIAINLKDLENTTEYFTVYGIDNANNKTNILRINNPYFVGDNPVSNTDKGVNNPQSVYETKPTSATGIITSHTDEDGEDILGVSYKEWKDGVDDTKGNGSKQFFTVKTKSDKVFYIVVDESYNQQTAYLLTEASENDLLNFVNYDGNTVDNGETTVYTVPKPNKAEVKNDEVINEEPVKEKSKNSSIGTIILIALVCGGVVLYKFKKKDSESEDEDEFEEELDSDLEQTKDDL